jgi:integrase
MRLVPNTPKGRTTPYREGANLDDVKRYLGHTNIEHTSELYGHWIEGSDARTQGFPYPPPHGCVQRTDDGFG